MKFLVTGSAGLIGSQVVKDLVQQHHTVFSCYHEEKPIHGTPISIDLTNKNKIVQILQETKPDRIIHLAAVTNVDLCETKQSLVTQVNTEATKFLAKQAAKQNIFFLYVSTDYIFDGIRGMKKENDNPNPLGFYGKSKLEGELALGRLASSWCIARTSTPFGLHHKKKSFPLWIKENLDAKKEIPVLVDQFTSPTYVPNLSNMLIEITTRQITGIIHVSGSTRISRYDLAKLVANKLNLNDQLLIPTKTDDVDWKAQRPADSSLDVSLANELLHEKPQKIEQSLDYFIQELKSS